MAGQGQSALKLIDGAQMPTTAMGHYESPPTTTRPKYPSPSSARAARLQKAIGKYDKTLQENISRQPYHSAPPEPNLDRTQERVPAASLRKFTLAYCTQDQPLSSAFLSSTAVSQSRAAECL